MDGEKGKAIMRNWPMTPEQETEMRERAQGIFARYPVQRIDIAIIVLQSFVFKDGRLSDTIARDTIYQIACEGRLPAGYELREEDDTFYVVYQGYMTGHDFASEGAARTFIWKRHNEGQVPMKSEEVI
jgi:hypothetical protein